MRRATRDGTPLAKTPVDRGARRLTRAYLRRQEDHP